MPFLFEFFVIDSVWGLFAVSVKPIPRTIMDLGYLRVFLATLKTVSREFN
ncbi:hypothetical protein V1499_19215 [Neobacillus sp. SCS-31]